MCGVIEVCGVPDVGDVPGVGAGLTALAVAWCSGLSVAVLCVACVFGFDPDGLAEFVELVIPAPPCISKGRRPDSRKIKPITAAIVLKARRERCA